MAITDKQIKFSFLREYHLILHDFDKILSFVDPSDENEGVFSHRIFELLLRTCTAVETVFKGILKDNNYTKKKMNVKDYFTSNSYLQLSEYEVILDAWRSGTKTYKPFDTWESPSYTSLKWYKAYNTVKHNRDEEFKLANLKNLTNAIAGLFVLLYSQYEKDVFGKYQETPMTHSDKNSEFIYSNDSIFSIKPPN